MALVQCDNSHYYDDNKHTRCPHCGVPGLKDSRVPETKAAPAAIASNRTATAAAGGGQHRYADSGPRRPAGSGAIGETIGITPLKEIDPVVGWLVCTGGVNEGRDYRLRSGNNLIGRAPNMDVCIEGDQTIARDTHCKIAYSTRHGSFHIVPGDGRNMIYLNGSDVLGAMPIKAYDKLEIGEGLFLFIPFCSDSFAWGQTGKIEKPRQDPEMEPDEDDDRFAQRTADPDGTRPLG